MNHRRTTRRKLRNAMREAQRHLPGDLPGLLYLTDPGRTADPVATARHLPRGSGIVYRHFGSARRCDVADRLARIAHRRHLILLIAADPVLAKHVGADGVHWPEAQRERAKRWRRAFAVQTTSAHSPAALRGTCAAMFDAVLVSTVFPSRSPSARHPIGALRFRRLCQGRRLPIYALGGVTAANAGRVSPVAGIAAVDAVENAFAS